MKPTAILKWLGLIALFVFAGYSLIAYLRKGDGVSEKVFFYDLSERKLFSAPRTSIPPIRGLNDAQEDGVRAVVISTSAKPTDKKSWKVAYLEKYAPELKAQMENAQKTGVAPELSRGLAQEYRYVRRVDEEKWYAMNTPEAERIVSEWASPGPDGVTPVVCSPP